MRWRTVTGEPKQTAEPHLTHAGAATTTGRVLGPRNGLINCTNLVSRPIRGPEAAAAGYTNTISIL